MNDAQARVLVTGATGLIGKALVRLLVDAGYEVHATSRNPSLAAPTQIHWHQVDLSNLDDTSNLVGRVSPTYVVNLAGDVRGTFDLGQAPSLVSGNLTTAINLVLSLAHHGGCRRLILAGSFIMEPASLDAPAESIYGATKAAAAVMTRTLGAIYDVPVVILRLAYVYGPGQEPEKILPLVLGAVARGERARLGSGARETDWVYVDDVAAAFAQALHHPDIDGAVLDIGSGQGHTVREVVNRLLELAGAPGQVEWGAVADRPTEPARIVDPTEAKRRLGWRAQTSLDEGLRKTIAWYNAAP